MNNINLLKAQANLALSVVDKRARIGIDNYIAALEAQVAENAAQQGVQADGAYWLCPKCEIPNLEPRKTCYRCETARP